MRVLIVHNRYREMGGEDLVALAEAKMLRDRGIEVVELSFDNEVSQEHPVMDTLRLGFRSAWSQDSYDKILEVCKDHRPHVTHVHNFWLKLSPAVHAASHAAGAATVQTLHNFRLMCTNALFLRESRGCEDCLGKVPWRGVLRRCYRDSFLASASVARMMVSNRRRGTWDRDVDAFIVLGHAARAKFVAGSLPSEKLFLKPNFVEDPGEALSPPSASDLVLYAGRLSEEKGIPTLLSAWELGELSRYGQLLIVGDGPQREALQNQAASLGLAQHRVTFAGKKDPSEMGELLQKARVLVLPSIWFEQFPRSVVEAFSYGRPMLVSDVSALNEILEQGITGLRFKSSDPFSLSEALKTLLTDGVLADRLGRNARAEYLAKYTPARNYEMLMTIYRCAMDRRATESGQAGTY